VTAGQTGQDDPAQKPRQRSPEGSRKRPKTGRKAVLNVTISESLAEEVRMAAALGHTTISSVVERALEEQVGWEITRLEGLAAIDAYYREHGYPAAEETAAAEAQVAGEERLLDEALTAMAAEGKWPAGGRTGRRRRGGAA
jgi:post-segregation antitoxin (ccd killing protein)